MGRFLGLCVTSGCTVRLPLVPWLWAQLLHGAGEAARSNVGSTRMGTGTGDSGNDGEGRGGRSGDAFGFLCCGGGNDNPSTGQTWVPDGGPDAAIAFGGGGKDHAAAEDRRSLGWLELIAEVEPEFYRTLTVGPGAKRGLDIHNS